MSSIKTQQRKRCVSKNCRGFAINKLPIIGEPIVHCKKCISGPKDKKPVIHWAEAEDTKGECSLCCESFMDVKQFTLSCCKQVCCTSCIIKAASGHCPFCRQSFKASQGIINAIKQVKERRRAERNAEIARSDIAFIRELQEEAFQEQDHIFEQREESGIFQNLINLIRYGGIASNNRDADGHISIIRYSVRF